MYFEPEADDYPLRPQLEVPAQVVGTTNLYENGQLNYIPMPTPDPKGRSALSVPHLKKIGNHQTTDDIHLIDPLNLPTWRKIAAIVSICFCEYMA